MDEAASAWEVKDDSGRFVSVVTLPNGLGVNPGRRLTWCFTLDRILFLVTRWAMRVAKGRMTTTDVYAQEADSKLSPALDH